MAVPFCFEDEDEDEDDVLSVPIMIQATARVREYPVGAVMGGYAYAITYSLS